MAKQLTLDEMLEVLITVEHPHASGLQASLEAIAAHMADQIGQHFVGVNHSAPKFEGTAFAGTCAPFWMDDGLEWPEVLAFYDPMCDA